MKCEIIKDLLPSYIDELTSEVSNEAVKEHLAECESCRSYYEEMKQQEPKMPETAEREIDYFLRVREETFRKILVAVTAAAVVFSILLGAYQNYYGGKSTRSDEVTVELQVIEGITTLVFEPVDEDFYITVGYRVNEDVDGKLPLNTLGLSKYRIKPWRGYDHTANRFPLSFREGENIVLNLHALPHELAFDERDFLAIKFDDGVKTITLADLRDGDISSLQ